MRRLVLAVASLALLASAAHAEERLVEVGKVFPFLAAYQSLPAAQRSAFTINYALRKDGKPVVIDVTLVETGGKRTPLPVNAEGRVTRLPTAAQLAAKSQVGIDSEVGKIGVNMLLESTVRPAADLPAAPFAPGLAQVNAAIALKAGMLASFAPKMTRVTFVGAPSGVAVMADGKEVALPLAKGGPAYDPVAMKGVRALKFPKAPDHIRFDGDK